MNLSLQLDESDKSPSVTPPRRRPAAASPNRRPEPKVIDLTDSPERVPPASASPLPLAVRLAQRQRRRDDSTEELHLERDKTSPKMTYEAALSPQLSPIASPERFTADDLDDDNFGGYDDPHEPERTTYSDPETPSKRPHHARAESASMDDLLAPVISSSQPVGRSAPPEPAVRKTAKQVADESKKRKADEKQQKAEAKEREKQQKRDERAKARKRTKEEAAAEMSVTIDRRVVDQRGAHILAELQKICTAATAELSVPGLIQWRRKGSVALEKALVLRMKAPDFAAQEEAAAFRPLVTQLQQQNPALKLIFLLESWNDLLRARQRDANAAYRAAILHNKDGDGAGAGVADLRAVAQLKLMLDDAILWLEVERHCQVWQTETPEQSALWLCTLTTQLGLLPYKPKPSFDSFCAEAAPKKAYATPVELWSQQLQCINGVSSDIAQAITLKYPTMASLLRVYASALNEREKRELLRNVSLLGADGQPGTRKVGQAVSEKVYRLFASTQADEVL